MPETDISICSKSLIMLGASPISSFNDETDAAKVCANVYPMVRASLCGKYPWRFLTKKKQLSRDAVAPIGEWKYAYVLPGDMLGSGPTALFSHPNHPNGEIPFEIFERRIYCNFENVWIDYQVLKDESTWPAFFVELMCAALCATIGFAITDQQGTIGDWTDKAFGSPSEGGLGGLFGTAMTLDSQGQSNTGVEANAFIDARFGGYTYVDGGFR